MKPFLLPLAAALVLISGCKHSFKTATYEDDLAMAVAEGSSDSLLFSSDLEYVTRGLPEEAMAKVNQTLAALAFDQPEVQGSLEETAIQYREQVIDEYLTEFSGGEAYEGARSWEESIEGIFMADYNSLKNYALTYYSRIGSNLATSTVIYLVFDPKTGELVPQDAFFREGWQEPVAELLRASLRSSLEDNEEVLELIDWDSVVPNGNYYVETEGMDWVFQPYEVGAYVYTIMSAGASWEELKPYLK